MDASRRAPWRAPVGPLAAILVVVLAACTSAASPSASPTTSLQPSVTATPTTEPSASPSPSAAAFPVTVVDDEGTSVEIAEEPEVIVSLTPAATETLFTLGIGDRIAGRVVDVFLYPPEAVDIPEVAQFDAVDIEAVVALEPDLVFAGGNFFTPPDAIARMRELGLTVVVLYAPDVATVYSDIELIGTATGRGPEAAAITAEMRAGFDAVAAALADAPRPRVFYELDGSTGTIYGPADESFLAEMIELAGGDPVTTGSPDKYDISTERLIEADPEVILLADAAFGMTAEQVKARAGWDVLTAVKNDDIRPIDDQTVTRPGPRLVKGLELLAATIHPDVAVPSSAPIGGG